MKRLTSILLVATFLGAAFAGDAFAGGGAGQKRAKHQRGRVDNRPVVREADVRFSVGEVRVIREYYAPRSRPLPPGLQKKLARGGALPPGWQKKLQPLPIALEQELIVLPDGYRRGLIDGYAVVYNPRTQVIVDITAIF